MWLKKLIAAFIKQNGRKPNAIETLQLKFRASDLADKGQVLKPNFGKTPLREFTRKENVYEGMIDPKSDTGKKLSKIRTTMGLPKALRNVKNPDEVKKLLESGDITLGTAPKTTKIKDPVDPKFKRAVESQDEQARLVKEFEARNKDSAFNFAFKKYKDIDRKPMKMDEVISIYTNLNKYPKGRSIIFGDIAEIQRRHMLPNIGNRSRDMLVNKLNKMIKSPKQPNPFKKAPDEVTEQIEMDFTDWDPKGMAGGGLAYMLGEPSRTPYKIGGSGRKDRMGGTMAQTAAELRTANPAEFAGGMNISHDGGGGPKPDTGGNEPPWYQHPAAKAATYMSIPVLGVAAGAKSLYDQYMKDKAIGTNITDAALSNSQYFGDTTKKMQRDYRKTTGLRTPDEPPRDDNNDNVLPWWLKKPPQSSLGLEAIKPEDDFDLNAVVEGRTPSRFYADGGEVNPNSQLIQMYMDEGLSYNDAVQAASAAQGLPWHILNKKADGGRIGFDKGGFNKGRRNFMKLMAGLASIPVVGKLFKGAKAIKAAKTIKLAPATGMPEWFPSLVNKVIKEGDDVTKKFGTIERETVHTTKLGETEAVTVYNNLDNGHIRVEYGGPEFDKTGKVIRASMIQKLFT